MKKTHDLIEIINILLSDTRILEDTINVLKEEIKAGGFDKLPIEKMPDINMPIEVVNKKFVYTKYEVGFANHYVARVAVGGVERCRNGVIVPKYFFATLHYSDDLRLITVDFHDEFD